MEQQPRLPLWFLIVNWALIAVAFLSGTYLGRHRAADFPEPQRTALEMVYHQVLTSHVDAQDEHDLLERAIAGMVKGLDPYSTYVRPSDAERYDESNSGRYQGIGAEMGTHGDEVVLHFPFANGPADRAGLLPGDQLTAVDGQALDSDDLRRRAIELVRGPADTDVRLGIRRGEAQLDVVVRRGDVQRPCVKWAHLIDAESRLGYLYLSDFHPDARDQVLAAIASLEVDGPLRGLVLDLRFDGGGLLDECIGIARTFIQSGTIVTQQRRGSEVVERHEAVAKQCLYPELPLVVLVNGQSASASEVLTGALQDHGRAVVVGEHTYGKGLVNTVYSWKGLQFRLKLTTGSYRTPNGRDIEGHYHAADRSEAKTGGIEPDLAIAVTAEQKQHTRITLDANEVPARHREANARAAARHGFPVPEIPSPANDAQLQQALISLRERVTGTASGGSGSGSGSGSGTGTGSNGR